MKKITLLIALFITSIGFSQDLLLGFEEGESGGLNGGPFGNGNALQVNLVDDAGTNGSKVAEFIANSDGEVWQGINLNLTSNVDLSTTQTMTIDVKSSTAITFLVKVNGGVGAAAEAAAAVTHNGDGNWQTLSFTFNTALDGKAAAANGEYASFVIHAYWAENSTTFGEVTKDERTFYVDNIKGPKAAEVVTPPTGNENLLGFEDGESGGLNGGPFGNADALQVNIVSDAGTNGTKVAEFIANSSGEVWQGINLNLSKNADLSATQTMTIDVKSATAITFLVKVNGGVSGAPEAAAEVTHNGDGTWQTLSFTFDTALDGKAAAANGVYKSFVIHAYWTAGQTGFGGVSKDERTFYVDNISGPSAAPIVEFIPTAAPSPTNADATILSIYNDTGAFNGKSAVWTQNYAFGVNQGEVDTDETESGVNNALKMDFSVAGWGAGTNAPVDITGMTHVHFDYYAPAGDAGESGHEFKFTIIGEGQGEMDYVIKETDGDATIQFDQWVSVDVPLSHYQNLGLTLDKFLQYKLGSSSDLNTKVVFFDNIYIYNAATAGVNNNKLSDFSIYPNPTTDLLNIATNSTIQSVDIFNILGKRVKSIIPNNSSSFNVADLASGVYLVKFISNNKIGTAKFMKQ